MTEFDVIEHAQDTFSRNLVLLSSLMLSSVRRLSAITKRFNNMTIDSAVAELLSLDLRETTVSSAGGGSSFASTSKITTKLSDGTEKQFFMKTGSGKEASVMFEGMKLSNHLN
jgi:hypothetical protein